MLATGGPGDARELAEYGVAARVDVVAVFGGDGTTMQAAAALVGTEVALGVIPGGTGNLLAGNLRIPASPARAARALVSARPQPFDLGRMERPGGYQYFAVACGAGYDARVMAATLSEHKRRWGMGAYVATTLRLIARYPEHACMSSPSMASKYECQCRHGAGGQLRRGDPSVRPARARASPPTTACSTWWWSGPTASPQSVRAVWDLLRMAPATLGGCHIRRLRPGPGDSGGDRPGPAGSARWRAGR